MDASGLLSLLRRLLIAAQAEPKEAEKKPEDPPKDETEEEETKRLRSRRKELRERKEELELELAKLRSAARQVRAGDFNVAGTTDDDE